MIGQKLGHYEVVARLGAGGMGVVYRGRDETLQRDVALKFVSPALQPELSARKTLLDEARMASRLNHPHICTIYEVMESDGQTCIVMEHVAGRTLTDVLADGPLPPQMLRHYGLQIAEALAHAHGRGILHRDLKSANVMVTSEGQVKVLDFGLACAAPSGQLNEITRSQDALEHQRMAGTLPYMAPEILRGEPATEAADIWALGIILFQMAAGQFPFRGRTGYDLTSAILRDAPPPLSEKLPAPLAGVISRCLQKDPALRYKNAGEARAALEAAASSRPSVPSVPRLISPRCLAAIVAALVLLVVLLKLVKFGAPNPPPAAQIQSLAVLPLKNLSGDANQEYLADGMTDALITELAQIGAVRVISRQSVMRYKDTQKSLRQIAEELKVQGIVGGSVIASGGRVAVNAQLLNAANDTHVWARRYDYEMRDVLQLHTQAASDIAAQIQVTLSPGEQTRLQRKQSVNPRAYEAYVKGRYFAARYEFPKALESFREAIDTEPVYALAHVGLADAYWGVSGTSMPANVAMPRARAAAQKALELDGSLAEAHASLANIRMSYDWDWPAAEREFQQAIQLSPNYADVRQWYGMYLIYMGRFAEAEAQFARAVQLDPLSPSLLNTSAWFFYHSRQFDQASARAKRALELEPDFFPAYGILIWCSQGKKDFTQALTYANQAERDPHPALQYFRSALLAQLGRRDEAMHLLEQNKRELAKFPGGVYYIALTNAELGEIDEAFRWLERAFQQRSEELLVAKVDPKLDRLRGDPRFKDLLKRMRLPQ